MNKILGNKFYIFLFSAPALILFCGFVIYPLLTSVFLSVQQTDGLSPATFVGAANFTKAFADPDFWSANLASLFLAVLAVLCDTVLGAVVAILLVQLGKRFSKFVRTSFLIPLVLSIAVISQLWLTIYHADWGLLNSFLGAIGLGALRTAWLINNHTAMICVAIVGMWWIFGFQVLLIYSGLKSIPEQYFEAAKIDGANFWQISTRITLPLLAEVIKVSLVMTTVGGLFTFPQVFIMTGGGPGNLTQTVMMYIYKQVFANLRFGYGSAVAVCVMVETFFLLIVLNRLIAREKIEF